MTKRLKPIDFPPGSILYGSAGETPEDILRRHGFKLIRSPKKMTIEDLVTLVRSFGMNVGVELKPKYQQPQIEDHLL